MPQTLKLAARIGQCLQKTMNHRSLQQTEKGTIAIAFVREALACIHARGLDADALLHRAGIAPALLHQPHARVTSQHYGALWHGIAQAIDDEFFGMDSHRMKVGSFTLMCHALIHSPTLERALLRAIRFMRVVLDDLHGELVREGSTARIVLHDSPHAANPKRAFAYGTWLMMLHGLACWLVGRRIPLERADFRCAEPDFSAEWRVLFSPELHFDQAVCGIRFASRYLDMPNLQNEARMKAFLREAPANFLVKYRNSDGLTARIRRRLRKSSPANWPDVAALARQFHLSEATLRRRLEAEGQSYRQIIADLRKDMAISLLADPRLSIADVASQSGFAETSAFYRAFRKWTGACPGDYRGKVSGHQRFV